MCVFVVSDKVYCVCCFFFFQAEDGIRDLVRSRGLGDVYKRQTLGKYFTMSTRRSVSFFGWFNFCFLFIFLDHLNTVSYTHLTLPTSDLV